MSHIPDPLEGWVREAMGAPILSESRATCGDCVMASETDWTSEVELLRFKPSLKCCTFTPALYNFQVGGILSRPDLIRQHGVVSTIARIGKREAVLPIGVMTTRAELGQYEQKVEAGQFGRDNTMRCPHFVVSAGECGIHRFRNSTCATWHCRFDRGKLGKGYWVAIQHLMRALERVVSMRMVNELLPGSDGHDWGEVTDREGFYRQCWERASSLSFPDILEGAPEELFAAANVSRRAARAIMRPMPVPEHPKVNPCEVIMEHGNDVLVRTHQTTDPCRIPVRVWRHLAVFDGRTMDEALAELERRGAPVDQAMLTHLLEWGVLG